MRVLLHLRIRIPPERRDDLLRFLAGALHVYEGPGEIRVRLLERRDAPDELIEVVEYASEPAYEADQRRVEEDPRMLALLKQWRALLAEAPEVETYHDVTDEVTRRRLP